MPMKSKSSITVKDFGWERIARRFKANKMGRSSLVGIQGDQAEVKREDYGTNVEIGAVQEFGTRDGRIPPRPFLRTPFDEHQKEYEKAFDAIYDRFLEGADLDVDLLLLGDTYRRQVIDDIKAKKYEEWADSTREKKEKAGKGGDVPLWDTGQMVGAITVVVEKLKRDEA